MKKEVSFMTLYIHALNGLLPERLRVNVLGKTDLEIVKEIQLAIKTLEEENN